MAENRLKIIGCGSLLMGDDGAGCMVARRLKQMELPTHVSVLEGGTSGLKLLNLMAPDERVIIVDAVVTGAEPGTIRIFNGEDLPDPEFMPLSAHQMAIPEAIALGRLAEPEMMPEKIEIWGIEVSLPLSKMSDLSADVAEAVDIVVEKLKKEILKNGDIEDV